MPRTRNVARLQENASSASYGTRPRNNNNENNNGHDSEKENDGRHSSRASRAQHRSYTTGGILGATTVTTLGVRTNAKGTTAAATSEPKKKKKKGKAPQREKLPLQDITSQFLPAPEAANRGEGYTLEDEEQVVVDDLLQTAGSDPVAPTEPAVQANPPSPLPPSSPPSDLSPFHHLRLPAGTRLQFDDIISPTSQGAQVKIHDAWDETYDFALAADRSSSDSSKSDPFGFVALERKLKAERVAQDTVAQNDRPEHHEYNDIDDIPFADTSSPRPVRRLKRSFSEEEVVEEEEEHQVDIEDEPASPARLATPPTPHKDKKKRPRLSHEGHNIFSPCTSSIESSPSPTKASARKPAASNVQDPLDEFNAEVDRTLDEIPTSVLRTRKQPPRGKKQEDEAAEEDDFVALLPKRRTKVEPEEQSSGSEDDKADEKPKKARRTKGVPQRRDRSHSRPASSKKEKATNAEEVDLPEKWEQERLERIEYFKRLEGYDLEKEDVHII